MAASLRRGSLRAWRVSPCGGFLPLNHPALCMPKALAVNVNMAAQTRAVVFIMDCLLVRTGPPRPAAVIRGVRLVIRVTGTKRFREKLIGSDHGSKASGVPK